MGDLKLPAHLPWRVSEPGTKADLIANHCFYMIAMGRWLPGSRLPAVRELESQWSVNRVTVLKAYRSLVARGLVDHKPNGAYYVAEQGAGGNLGRDRTELENLYEDILKKIRSETDMSPLGVLRMLARMEESKLRESPEVAFLECSRAQATDHAREITDRFHVPVLPLVLDGIRGKRVSIPPQVKVIFTTSFHIGELKGLKKRTIEVAALPVEISPALLKELADRAGEAVFLETSRRLATRTEKDAVWMMGIKNPRVEMVADVGKFLSDSLETDSDSASRPLFLVPQKEWEGLDAKWHEHASVRPISCILSDSAWQTIADTLRIPFGPSF